MLRVLKKMHIRKRTLGRVNSEKEMGAKRKKKSRTKRGAAKRECD